MKKFIISMVFIVSMWCSYCLAAGEVPVLSQIEYDIKVNSNGSINVTELWKISELNSNVINMNLQIQDLKFSDVSDIKITRGATNFESGDYNKENIKTGNYTVNNDNGKVNILCGIGRYKDISISYTVKDRVTLYEDCADLELLLLDRSNGIIANSINGKISYPTKVNKNTDVYAWKMFADINYEIENKDLEKVVFDANGINEDGVRVRVLMPNSKFQSVSNIIGKLKLEEIISEEKDLVFSSNLKNTVVKFLIALVEGTILVVIISKTFKYIKEFGKLFKNEPVKKIKYSRELPYNGITPGQAAFTKDVNLLKIGDVFSAALLNMKFKGIIDITYRGETNNLDNAYIKILEISPELEVEEKPVFDFLVDCMDKFQKADLSISLKMLQKYISHTTSDVSKLKKEMQETIKHSISSYNPKADKTVNRRTKAIVVYVGIVILALIIPGFLFDLFTLRAWILIISLINIMFCTNIVVRTNILGEEGIAHKEKLKALERYMLDFSKFKHQGVPELSIWEFYLIYAMAFGISKNVLDQISACYPNLEETNFMDNYIAARNIEMCNFKNSFLMSTSSK